MDIVEALGDDVTLREFFMECVPELFEARREEFSRLFEFDVILCFKFQDSGEIYSIALRPDGAEVEDDEMIDFPLITLQGWAKFWDVVKREARPLARDLEERRHEVDDAPTLTQAFFDDWEKFDVVIDVEITGDDDAEPVQFSLILNDYEAPDRARKFGFTVELQTLAEVASGKRDPVEAAKGLKIRGDVGIAATLGGMILSHTE